MKVLALPADERPREKLARFGVSVLSDAELVALLLGSGTKGKNVMEVARDVLSYVGGLQGLCESSLVRAKGIPGIGKSKMALLSAIGEIVRRAQVDASETSQSIEEVALSFQKRHYEAEEAHLLILDGRGRVTRTLLLSKGGTDKVGVLLHDILRLVLQEGATRFALLHVHPSGIPLPSGEDLRLTMNLAKQVGELHLTFFDHLIVSSEGVYSFKEQGHLPG